MAAIGQFGNMGVELVQGNAAGAVLVLAEARVGKDDAAALVVHGDFRHAVAGHGRYRQAKRQTQQGAGQPPDRSGPKEHVQDHALSPGPFPAEPFPCQCPFCDTKRPDQQDWR